MSRPFRSVRPETRRRMAKVRQSGTSLEILVRRALHARGVRYRVNGCHVAGRPDVYSLGRRVAVFIDGCFWHGCPACNDVPSTRRAFWTKKFAYNRARREAVRRELVNDGWLVVEVWEHEIRDDLAAVVERVAAALATRQQPHGGGGPRRKPPAARTLAGRG